MRFRNCITWKHLWIWFMHSFFLASANYGKKTIFTTFGVIRGETIMPEIEDLPAVTQYLGIPYGVAPTGQYRFNMAISAAKWTHQPKDAFRVSPVCVQSGITLLSETE
uniref:Carboxylesterase type B domain-containing protein n=1 Tax=Acrobeloides nanus TaxID=290746 RepID=A0A914EIE0_9BILA